MTVRSALVLFRRLCQGSSGESGTAVDGGCSARGRVIVCGSFAIGSVLIEFTGITVDKMIVRTIVKC